MHRSRLVGFIIDCQTDDVAPAASFWGAALGRSTRVDPDGDRYMSLESRPGDLLMAVQRVDHPSRVHLDIETDDLEAEAQRLEKLGARRVGSVSTWLVMEAPTGHRFCLVRPQRGPLGDDANQWE